jgi:UDP-N-acetylmuramoyl-tripeptide--D-alanyl-D-alanine ligase
MPVERGASVMGAIMEGRVEGSITGVSIDTRTLAPGDLFFALQGENSDGHAYVADAFRKGAAAAVVEREVEDAGQPQLIVPDALVALGDLAAYYRDQFDVPVVAVTGSVGKTTTKEMTAAALRSRFDTLASERNFNNEIGVPLTLFGLEPKHEAVIVEMGMRGPGEIARLAEIARPTVGLITNIGLSHIERLGSREGIAKAKAELIEGLPEDGVAILPADDDFSGFLLDTARMRCRAVTYGRLETANYRLADIQFSDEGFPSFTINGALFCLSAPGTHLPINAAAATAVAASMGIPVDEVAAALASYIPPAMRLQTIESPAGWTILDDTYNAAPDSMRAALETLVQIAGSRRAVAVLGEMRELGEFSAEAHELVGRIAADQPLGLLVTVGPAAEGIGRTAASRLARESIISFGSTSEAANELPALLRGGDVVLVKGSRAMEMEKIVETLRS